MDSQLQDSQILTPRQVQLLGTIAGYQSSRGYSPTIGELAAKLGISRTTAFGHIEQLRRKGLVSHQPGRARSLRLTSKGRRLLNRCGGQDLSFREESGSGIPLLGKVAAGLPVEAVENKEYLSIDSCFGNGGEIFALEVRGESMIGEGISPGDYVICRRSVTARDGELVVAIVDNDNATLKRFYKEPSRARLEPANRDYQAIYSDNCRIEGVVVGLVRKF